MRCVTCVAVGVREGRQCMDAILRDMATRLALRGVRYLFLARGRPFVFLLCFRLLFTFTPFANARKPQCDTRQAGLRHGKLAAKLASELSLTAADNNFCSIDQTVAHLLIMRLTFYILCHYLLFLEVGYHVHGVHVLIWCSTHYSRARARALLP